MTVSSKVWVSPNKEGFSCFLMKHKGFVHWLLSSPQAPLRGIQLPCLDSLHWVFIQTPLSILHLFGWRIPALRTVRMPQSPFWPHNGLVGVVSTLSCPGELRSGYGTSIAAGVGLSGEEGPPLTCWLHFSLQPRILLAYFTLRVHCWLMVKLVIHHDLK